jgi:hypothetical protein
LEAREFYQVIKRGNIQRSWAGLESGRKTTLAESNGQAFAERGHSK